jgi:hypothetical protein
MQKFNNAIMIITNQKFETGRKRIKRTSTLVGADSKECLLCKIGYLDL